MIRSLADHPARGEEDDGDGIIARTTLYEDGWRSDDRIQQMSESSLVVSFLRDEPMQGPRQWKQCQRLDGIEIDSTVMEECVVNMKVLVVKSLPLISIASERTKYYKVKSDKIISIVNHLESLI